MGIASIFSRKPANSNKPEASGIEGAVSETTVSHTVAEADPKPRPLVAKQGSSPEYPVDALGPVPAAAARAIQDKTDAPMAICAQSILAVMALIVMAFINVLLPKIGVRPTNLMFVTVAKSGERKSTVDRLALAIVRKIERALVSQYKKQLKDYEQAQADKDVDSSDLERPLNPKILTQEPTYEGLLKQLGIGSGIAGLFTEEGGNFLGGHAMSRDNQRKTTTGLSMLWDGSSIDRPRVGSDETFTVEGKRCAMHVMVQPRIAGGLFGDEDMIDQGIISRLLVSWPESKIGTRLWRDEDPMSQKHLDAFEAQASTILSVPFPCEHGEPGVLSPRSLPLSDEAKEVWIEFYNEVELKCAEGAEYEIMTGPGTKLAENAARISAVLAFFSDPLATEVSKENMEGAVSLARYYGQEMLRVFEGNGSVKELDVSQKLLDWLQINNHAGAVYLTEIYQKGPPPFRKKDQAKAAIHVLEEHGWLVPLPANTIVDRKARREAWRLVAA